MLPLPSFLAPATVHARVLNKLLRREDWARERLGRHSGKTVRFRLGGYRTGLAIQSDGLLQPSDPAVVPDVTLTIPADRLADLPGVLRSRDPALLTALLHVEGDAGLAQTVSELARDLRWDIEDDLSRVVGDVAAARMLHAGAALANGLRGAARRLADNTGEFLTEESALMASRPAFQDWAAELRAMQARLEKLDQRVAALAPRSGRGA